MENNENLNNQVNENNNVQKETKNNSKVLIIIMALVIVGLVGYIVWTSFIQKSNTNEPKDNNTQETNTSNLDVSQISTKSFELKEFDPQKLDIIESRHVFELDGENNASMMVRVDGTKATILYRSREKNITKEIDNVSKVFYSDYGLCSPHKLVYVISNEKVYLVNIDNYSDLYEETLTEGNFLKEIDNSNNYDSIYRATLHPATCDFIPLWLGHTADGKYYDLATNTEFKENAYYYYDDGNNYINSDETYKLGNDSGVVKLAFVNEVSEFLDAYINTNDYFYEYNHETNKYNKLSDKKVTEIKIEEDILKITFADGSKQEIQMETLAIYK